MNLDLSERYWDDFLSSQIKWTVLWVDVQQCDGEGFIHVCSSASLLHYLECIFNCITRLKIPSATLSKLHTLWNDFLVSKCAFFFFSFGASSYRLNLRSMYIWTRILPCFWLVWAERGIVFSSALCHNTLQRSQKSECANKQSYLCMTSAQLLAASFVSRFKGCVHKTFYLATNSSPK